MNKEEKTKKDIDLVYLVHEYFGHPNKHKDCEIGKRCENYTNSEKELSSLLKDDVLSIEEYSSIAKACIEKRRYGLSREGLREYEIGLTAATKADDEESVKKIVLDIFYGCTQSLDLGNSDINPVTLCHESAGVIDGCAPKKFPYNRIARELKQPVHYTPYFLFDGGIAYRLLCKDEN